MQNVWREMRQLYNNQIQQVGSQRIQKGTTGWKR